MYSIFEELLKSHNVTAYRVAKETGITPSTFAEWKKGTYIPKVEKLQKVADYFGVTVDHLMGLDKRLVSGDDRVQKLAQLSEDMIDVMLSVAEKGYTASDIQTALVMLDIARNK